MAHLPVVLAHGIFRIDQIRVLLRDELAIDKGPHYFHGIAPFLQENGFTVAETDVSFCGSLEKRAGHLATAIRQLLRDTGVDRVNIIAHSMGGLDARKVIVDSDLTDSVGCLTTIGTPHHGSSAADDLGNLGGRFAIARLKRFIDFEGFNDLTTRACAEFNTRAEKREADNKVIYRVVSASEGVLETVPVLQPTALRLQREGPSDGIVPTHSQRWVPQLIGSRRPKTVEQIAFPFPADHLNEIGWWDPGAIGHGLLREPFEERVKRFYFRLAVTAEHAVEST